MSLAAAKKISIDAAVDGDFSEPGGFFILKEERVSSVEKMFFALLPPGFGKTLIKHSNAGQCQGLLHNSPSKFCLI